MNLRLVATCGLVGAALLVSGCDSGRQPPARVGVQVANAAPGFETLQFRRESDLNNQTGVVFETDRAFVWDADTYDFYVTESLAASDPGKVWTFQSKLEANTAYSIVLTEVAGEVQPVVIPIPTQQQGADAKFVALNATSGLPAMDLYLERAGVGIAGATPRGTFN